MLRGEVSTAFTNLKEMGDLRQWGGISGQDDDFSDSTVESLCAFVGTLCALLDTRLARRLGTTYSSL